MYWLAEVCRMPKSFGARLRQHREEQAITLITVSEQTKIQVALLEALERDDVSHWPSGIFRRSFIRAYSHAIGLDPDVVFREFVEVHPEPADIAAALAAAAAEAARTNGGPPNRFRDLVGSALGSLSRRRRSPVIDTRPPVNYAARVDDVPEPTDPIRDSMASPAPEPAPGAKADAPAPPRSEPASAEGVKVVAAPPPAPQPDLTAVARLCTRFARVENPAEIQPLLQEAARILEAIGLIVWIWDPVVEELRPALVHGYSDRVLAQIPPVKRDADNATAAAFRSAEARAIGGGDHSSGALVVPLLTPAGCAGVLALELQRDNEPTTAVRSVATILAALLAQLIGDRVPEDQSHERIDSTTEHAAESSWK
jgi:Helix-turn-helix domain